MVIAKEKLKTKQNVAIIGKVSALIQGWLHLANVPCYLYCKYLCLCYSDKGLELQISPFFHHQIPSVSRKKRPCLHCCTRQFFCGSYILVNAQDTSQPYIRTSYQHVIALSCTPSYTRGDLWSTEAITSVKWVQVWMSRIRGPGIHQQQG